MFLLLQSVRDDITLLLPGGSGPLTSHHLNDTL